MIDTSSALDLLSCFSEKSLQKRRLMFAEEFQDYTIRCLKPFITRITLINVLSQNLIVLLIIILLPSI